MTCQTPLAVIAADLDQQSTVFMIDKPSTIIRYIFHDSRYTIAVNKFGCLYAIKWRSLRMHGNWFK